MIKFVNGDFFKYNADIRVNTVNCVGVMGAGVALAFKNKYPLMFNKYKEQCQLGQITPGNPQVWREKDLLLNSIEIINFPTKDDWRKPSKYEYIEQGLKWLSTYLSSKNGSTVTLPALGCGHGGLDWEKVKVMIQDHLEDSPANILVFEPDSSKKINSNIDLAKSKKIELFNREITVINFISDRYPYRLSTFTKSNLYVYGNKDLNYDLSIISSTTPDDEEKNIINKIVRFSEENKISILFGSSAYDKKQALIYSDTHQKAAVTIPTNIIETVSNIKNKYPNKNITIISIGDPSIKFDKKEYLPSVFCRISLAKYTIFTTPNLGWLIKHKSTLSSISKNLYYFTYKELEPNVLNSINKLNIVRINNELEDLTNMLLQP